MRRFVPAIWPFVALALMGNSCEFRAGVNNSIPPSEGEEPRQESGLRVLVQSGDPLAPLAVAPALDPEPTVAAALSMSALTSEHFSAPQESDQRLATLAASEWQEPPGLPPVSAPTPMMEGPVAAVPEPGGLWLFAIGLGATSILRRKVGASAGESIGRSSRREAAGSRPPT